jgi:hypothetical protein
MKNKFTKSLSDFFSSDPIFRMWGGVAPISMGDGIRFRVTKSPRVDYVYVRYLSGFEEYEVEFAALVGAEYDVLDRIKPVSREELFSTINKNLFFNV